MKSLIFIFLLTFTSSAFAIEDISGNWTCYNDSGVEFTFDFNPSQKKVILTVNGNPQTLDLQISNLSDFGVNRARKDMGIFRATVVYSGGKTLKMLAPTIPAPTIAMFV